MAAQTADVDRQSWGAGREMVYPMAIGSSTTNTIYKGSLVSLTGSSGYAVSGSDTSGDLFVGVCIEKAVNTGAAGAASVRVFTVGDFLFTHATGDAEITYVNDLMYVATDNEVDDTAALNNGVNCGYVSKWVSLTQVWLRIDGYAPLPA